MAIRRRKKASGFVIGLLFVATAVLSITVDTWTNTRFAWQIGIAIFFGGGAILTTAYIGILNSIPTVAMRRYSDQRARDLENRDATP